MTAYPELGLLAGACASHGLLVDIRDPLKPMRLDAKADTNFSLWHTAVFSNDGSKVVFTDEWGGGTSPNCQATHPLEMGGNTTLLIRNGKMTQHAYFKIPSAQSPQENCVSHNGGLIPVPGRDIMVQGWYQGGVDVIDFTDPDHPFEIAFFDRGPADLPPAAGDTASVSRTRGTIGGSWGAYWYNGLIYSSELARGFDVLELLPSDQLSANELAAAKLVRMAEYNPQSQPKITWPAAFSRWCARTWTSWCAAAACPPRTQRRSRRRSMPPSRSPVRRARARCARWPARSTPMPGARRTRRRCARWRPRSAISRRLRSSRSCLTPPRAGSSPPASGGWGARSHFGRCRRDRRDTDATARRTQAR
ncbi:MAG: LVIVD repeat-containing protein [Gemmatimonadaceae bacterium]